MAKCKTCGEKLEGGVLGIGGRCYNPTCSNYYSDSVEVSGDRHVRKKTTRGKGGLSNGKWKPGKLKLEDVGLTRASDEEIIRKYREKYKEELDPNVQLIVENGRICEVMDEAYYKKQYPHEFDLKDEEDRNRFKEECKNPTRYVDADSVKDYKVTTTGSSPSLFSDELMADMMQMHGINIDRETR